jgi:hypothetical protein
MARDGFFNTDSQKDGLHVAVQILVAVVAELRLYGIWPAEGRFAELLRILEKDRHAEFGGVGALGLSV